MSEQVKRPQRRGPHGRGPAEKPKDFKKAMAQLLRFLKPFLVPVVVALAFAVAGTVLNLLGPNYVEDLTDLIEAGFVAPIDMAAVTRVCILLVVLYGCGLLFSYIQGLIMASVTQKNAKALRTAISQKINRLPLKYFDSHAIGDVLSRVTNDVDMIGQTLNQSLVTFVTAVVMLIGSVVMMFVTNWVMALTAIIASLVGFVFMFLIMGKSQKYFVRQQRFLGEIDGHIEEVYAGHNVVKAYNAERAVGRQFADINYKLYTSAWKAQFFSGLMQPLMAFIGNLGYVAVCVAGALLVSYDVIGFGVIIAFTLYVRLFTSPLSQLAQAFTSMQTAAAASERVFEFLSEGELSDESGKTAYLAPEKVKGEVTFEHVRFGYDPEKPVLHDFTLHAERGELVAIVGHTGAGKTTLVNLLMRFYDAQAGRILIDGKDITEVTRASLRRSFAMVLQDTWLFSGSVLENVRYGSEDASREDVERVCREAKVASFVEKLPAGYDTMLTDNAVNISKGQKQLITIARAMLSDAPMLILDEATSNVDTRTEQDIQAAMERLMEGRTCFVIAHRLSTIRHAKNILVMDHGDVVEQGTHEELLARGGTYAKLYAAQFDAGMQI